MLSARDTTGRDLGWIEPAHYRIVRTPGDFSALEDHLAQGDPNPAVDTETSGLSPLFNILAGISFSPGPTFAYYLPLNHRYFDNFPFRDFLSRLRSLLSRFAWTTFNGGFDWKFLKAGLDVDIKIARDVQADAWLIDSDRGPQKNRRKLRLDYRSKELLGIDQLHLEDLLPKGVYDFTLVQDEIDALYYTGGDVDCTMRVRDIQRALHRKLGLDFVSRVEADVVVPTASMELNGVYLDMVYADSLDLRPELERLRSAIESAAGRYINPGSPDQVAALIYDDLRLLEPAKDGSRSSDDDTLDRIKDAHPAVQLIRDWREVSKIDTAFLKKLREVAAEDGRLHAEFCATGTRSGRYASSGGIGPGGSKIKFNGQNLPKPDEEAMANCRKILAAPPGTYWLSADFKQVEYILLAFISQDKGLMDGIMRGVDFHVNTCSMMFGIPPEQVDDEKRRRGKTLNFGVVYGMSDAGLALQLGIPIKEAATLRRAYFDAVPAVERLINSTMAFVQANGYVTTEFGSRRNFDFSGLDPKRVQSLLKAAFNTRIQGTAAVLNKIQLRALYDALNAHFKGRFKLLSTIHDETNIEFSNEVPVGEAAAFVMEHMAVKPGLKPGWLDIGVDIEVGPSYGELVGLPKSLHGTVRTLAEALEAAKARKKPKDKAASSPVSAFRGSQNGPLKRKVVLTPPAAVVDLGDFPADEAIQALHAVVDKSFGTYALYLKTGNHTLLCNDTKVNPAPKFVQAVNDLGFKVQLHRPADAPKFDPNKLKLL